MIGLLFLFAACQEKVTSPARVDTLPSIFPDYVGVTIPSTIAPLNFRVTDDGVEAVDVVIAGTIRKACTAEWKIGRHSRQAMARTS